MNCKNRINVSIIIPIYRVQEELLERCMESILQQEISSLEVLAVFDGSGAEDALISRYRGKGLQIRTIVQKHCGVSAARNNGLKNARGKYIFFIDADDRLEKGGLKRLLTYVVGSGADFVMADYGIERGQHTVRHCYLEKRKMLRGDDIYRLIGDILKPQTGAGFCWGKLFRKDFLDRNDLYFNERLSAAEDAEFMVRAALKADTVGFLDEVVYYYQIRPDSTVRRYDADYAGKYTEALKLIKIDLKEALLEFEEYHSCVLYHLILIASNFSFHPDCKWKGKEQIRRFAELAGQEPFRSSLCHIRYRDFSVTRAVTLWCIRHQLFTAVKIIAGIRHMQLGMGKTHHG